MTEHIDRPAYEPTWYTATMTATPERASLTYDLDVDVCVIGAGLAGLTAARELGKRGWSVAVIEAERIASHASGRNGGFVSPGFAERLPRIVERVGIERAKEIWALSAGGVDYVSRAIRETEMPGVDPVPGWLTVWRLPDEQGVAAQAALLGEEFGVECEAWSTAQVRDMLRTERYYQGLYQPGAFHIHPLNYALGLAADAERAGVRIFEATRALAIDPAGVRKRIDTAKGRVRCAQIVLAGGPHLRALFPYASETVIPVATYIGVTAPLGERLLEAVRYTGAVSDTRRAGNYFRIVGTDRLLWGGGITTRTSTPRGLAAIMSRDIAGVFPALHDVSFDHAWSGLMAYAVHKMPQIGELAPGIWLASAFGGHGLNTTAMAGDLVARAIVDGDDRWRLFSPYELVWAGGTAGRVAAQAVYWWMQARDAIDETRAQRREANRLRAEARAAALLAAEAQRAEEEAARKVAEDAAALAAERAAAQRASEEAALAPAQPAPKHQATFAAAAVEPATVAELAVANSDQAASEPPARPGEGLAQATEPPEVVFTPAARSR